MQTRIRSTAAAAMLLLAPAFATFVATPAAAQQVAPQVSGLSLNSDNELDPGATLRIAVTGTPGARVVVNFGRTDINVTLREVARGSYRANYVVRRADRIDPTNLLNVRMTRGNLTTRQAFTYPASFQALAMGAAPAPAIAEAPRIDRFVVRPMGRLEPGRELRFRVIGAAGANVTLEVPGVVAGLPMRETEPGRYEATYTVRQRDNLDAFNTAIATLRSGNRWVTSRLDRAIGDRDRGRDNRPPEVVDMTPRQGEVVPSAGRTRIAADFEDRDGRGVNPATVRVTLQGRDVTSDSRITAEGFVYRADLPPGRYTAEVTARDFAGNAVSKSWSFDVGTRVGAGPMPLTVSTPANNAQVDANGNLVVQGQTAPFATVRVRVDAIPPIVGQLLGVAQNVFTGTVQADRNGLFTVNVNARSQAIPGTRYDVQLSATQGNQTADSRITLYQRG